MFRIRQSKVFSVWLRKLRDPRGKARIVARIDSCRLGNLGDTKGVGAGVRELRVHIGPGYRVYFAKRGTEVVVLLCGGDKSSQTNDIKRAQALLAQWED